ncbi:methyl-accepting chemotaxis protein [Lachnospiraceae bacterium 54-53]
MNKQNSNAEDTRKEKGSFMKNLTISQKLILGFGFMLLLIIASNILSALSIKNIGFQAERYYRYTVPNTNSTWTMRADLVSTQKYLLQAILDEDAQSAQNNLEQAKETSGSVSNALNAFAGNQSSSARENDIAQLRDLLSQAGTAREEISELLKNPSKANDDKAYELYQTSYLPVYEQAQTILFSFSSIQQQFAAAQKQEAQDLMSSAWLMLALSLGISLLLAVIITYGIRKSILVPVKEIDLVYREISKGNLNAQITYEGRDELGSMAGNIRNSNAVITAYIHDITEKLNLLAQGDMRFSVDLDYIGDFKAIKQAILKTVSSLNRTLILIDTAAGQVNTGTEQVSAGAQELAAGSTEQASSVEELSASITSITAQAEENSENVKKAAQYVEQTSQNVKNGGAHMKQLTEAMDNIGSASDQITNITKVIEDIAFQTNILSLNAAIEAARAGTAGKGFSVVADEVRNLAAKSAEAAKQTAELIQHSVSAVEEGTQITRKTAQILADIDETTGLINVIVNKINAASSEQATSIEQIRIGLEQVSAVIQTNAATAEENSAASEEMSAQANTLRDEVGKFRLNEEPKEIFAAGADSVTAIPPCDTEEIIPESHSEKY